jgi:hypothetical protein
MWRTPRGGAQLRLGRGREAQGSDEPLDRVSVRVSRPTLQLLNASYAQTRLFGEGILRQSGRYAVPSEQLRKRARKWVHRLIRRPHG